MFTNNNMGKPNLTTFNLELSGLHPRSEVLVDLTRSYDRNKTTWENVRDQLDKETREIVNLQENSGVSAVTDGAIGWKDQLRPVLQTLHGLRETTRYSRWYDTNTFYQKPVVTDMLRVNKIDPTVFLDAKTLPKNQTWKVILPGPYTLTELSEDKYYQSGPRLLQAYTEVLHEIVLKLREAGVKHFQFSEPSLVYWPYRKKSPNRDELEAGVDATDTIIDQVPNAKFSLTTFFGDASPIFSSLLNLHVDSVGIDLYETDSRNLPRVDDKELVLGIVDSEESSVETPGWIAKTALKVREKTQAPSIVLSPNTDLKFVPRLIADQKLASLGKATTLLQQETFS